MHSTTIVLIMAYRTNALKHHDVFSTDTTDCSLFENNNHHLSFLIETESLLSMQER
jgi:hypothetical protein